LALVAFVLRGVDRSGAVAGAAAGTALFVSAGWRGYILLVALFVLAAAATRAGQDDKSARGIAEERGGRRGAGSVLANISVGVVFAVLAQATAYTALCTIAMTAAFATAACDTVSSEIGKAYGRRHCLVATLRRVDPGTAGAVTVIGTLSGLAAAALLAAAAWGVDVIDGFGMVAVTFAAFIATVFESFLRAASVESGYANLANTMAGGLLAMAIYAVWSGG
jgi:uncharacterized protein (TIGR00297 family)